ncbi:odorant receptor 131-2-like [Pholidichthys leucotaenia]
MAENRSLDGMFLRQQIKSRIITVQILVIVFLCVNLLLIVTFFQRECFYTCPRYILFAVTLISDRLVLFISNFLLLLDYFQSTLQVWLCIIISFVVILCTIVTPVTLTVMALECYVAICMPLRHAELCSTRSTVHCVIIIHSLSSVYCIVIFSLFFASASFSIYGQYRLCSVQLFILHRWQDHIRSSLSQFYFLIMCIAIFYSYVQIMKAAKAASGKNKKLTNKGLRTVVLHAFQLLLCLIRFWCPFIETAVLQIDFILFINVRYFNYIMFILVPKCINPLIYGLRDKNFSLALKNLFIFKNP